MLGLQPWSSVRPEYWVDNPVHDSFSECLGISMLRPSPSRQRGRRRRFLLNGTSPLTSRLPWRTLQKMSVEKAIAIVLHLRPQCTPPQRLRKRQAPPSALRNTLPAGPREINLPQTLGLFRLTMTPNCPALTAKPVSACALPATDKTACISTRRLPSAHETAS